MQNSDNPLMFFMLCDWNHATVAFLTPHGAIFSNFANGLDIKTDLLRYGRITNGSNVFLFDISFG